MDAAASLPTGEPVLEVANVGYRYGQSWALSGVTFTLRPRSLTVLAGRNGAGKSTLLRCLAGWTRPTRGEVTIASESMYLAERQARARVLLVPDTPPFYDELTEWEHVQFVAQANRLTDWRATAESWLRQFGLWHARDAYPFSLSRGMKYKLALCLALMLQPPLLLLDEPTAHLDPENAAAIRTALHRLMAGRTVLLVTHEPAMASIAHQVITLQQGRVAGQEAPP